MMQVGTPKFKPLTEYTNNFPFLKDINECKLRGGNTCSPLERCINTPGSYRCEKGTTEAACKLGEQLVDGSCVGECYFSSVKR